MIDRERETTILRLFKAEGWPVGTIARHVGVHHSVVRRVLRQAGQELPRQTRPSRVDGYVRFVQETWARWPKLTASRLYRMCCKRGYAGSPDHFRHMVARLRPEPRREAFLRLRTLPGEQAQVDWAHFGHVEIGRARRPLVAFVMVLSFSRAVFVRFSLSMTTEDFLRGHQEAFAFWGGVARVHLYDNLKSAVIERIGQAIRFNPLLLEFAAHHGYEPRPVAPGRGSEKGRVERAIRYVRGDFFLTRGWRTLEDLNGQALLWCRGPAMERRWPQDAALTVQEAFETERVQLLALPPNPFPVHERREVGVGKTPYLRFDRNDYSVPARFVHRTLTVLATPEEVRILDGSEEVARHVRSYDAGGQIEDPAHIEELVEAKRAARRHRGMDRLAHAAPSSRALLERLAERGANLGTNTARLLRLLDAHGAVALERALREVLARDVPHVDAVGQVLARERAAEGAPPALALALPARVRDLVVRPHDLEDYDALAGPASPDEAPDEEDSDDDPSGSVPA